MFCLAWGSSFARPELCGIKTDVAYLEGTASDLIQKCRSLLMHPKLGELISKGVNFAHFPDVVSKVVTDGDRVLLYKGVSTQILDIYGTLALNGQL